MKERESYLFTVLRLVVLPDDTTSWLLTHDGHDRYLLPAGQYSSYPIREGEKLLCRVDKINCTGRIYLEPKHPWYEEGLRYRFLFSGQARLTDGVGNLLWRCHLRGTHGDLHEVLLFGDATLPPEGTEVEAEVLRIRKGVLTLKLVGSLHTLTEGGRYRFTVLSEEQPGYYVVEGPGGVKSLLDKAWYREYGFRAGDTFHAVFGRWNPERFPLIEPDHPVYRPGNTYSFNVRRSEPSSQHDKDGVSRVLIAEDCFGNEIKVFQQVDGGLQPSTEMPQQIACTVERMKRGKPVLRLSKQAPEQ